MLGDSRRISRARLIGSLLSRIQEEAPKLIALKREGAYWDFKKEWHKDNSELIHDILCLANNLEGDVSYLFIGIDEEEGYSVCDVENNDHAERKTNQMIVDMLSKTKWDNGQPPFAVVEPMELDGGTIDILCVVSRREDMPYSLSKGSGKVRAHMVHTRRVDSNTPIDEGASWNEVEDIWRHHFSLDESPLARVKVMLEDKEHWRFLSEVVGTEDKYYLYAPEFTVCHYSDDERDGYEYYMLNQTDPSPSWYMIEIRYFQTRIFDTLGIALDGGRYFAPAPSRSFVRWNRRSLDFNLMYCYYTRDSLDWNLNEFFFDENYGDARIARRRFLETVVIFQDEEERKGFEILLRERHSEFEEEMSEAPDPYGAERLPEDYPQEAKDQATRELKAIHILKRMLEEFRDDLEGLRLPTSRDW